MCFVFEGFHAVVASSGNPTMLAMQEAAIEFQRKQLYGGRIKRESGMLVIWGRMTIEFDLGVQQYFGVVYHELTTLRRVYFARAALAV